MTPEQATNLTRLHVAVLCAHREELEHEIGEQWAAFIRGAPLDDSWRTSAEYERIRQKKAKAQDAFYRAINELELEAR